MSSSVAHKSAYVNFIVRYPSQADTTHVNEAMLVHIGARFQALLDETLALLPNTGAPVDAYVYASYMGAYVRGLDDAKDHFIKALYAFYYQRVGLQTGQFPNETG